MRTNNHSPLRARRRRRGRFLARLSFSVSAIRFFKPPRRAFLCLPCGRFPASNSKMGLVAADSEGPLPVLMSHSVRTPSCAETHKAVALKLVPSSYRVRMSHPIRTQFAVFANVYGIRQTIIPGGSLGPCSFHAQLRHTPPPEQSTNCVKYFFKNSSTLSCFTAACPLDDKQSLVDKSGTLGRAGKVKKKRLAACSK